MKKETSSGSVIFSLRDGEYYTLLTQNLKGRHWSFPKGHVEGSETLLDTARREVLEETGVSVNPINGFKSSVEYRVGPHTVKTVWYFVSIVDPDVKFTPQPEEVSDIRWLPYDTALSELTYKRDAEILRSAYDFISERK